MVLLGIKKEHNLLKIRLFCGPDGTKETEKDFLEKPQTKEIIKNLKKGLTIKDICKIVDCSNKTIIKTKRIGFKHQLLILPN